MSTASSNGGTSTGLGGAQGGLLVGMDVGGTFTDVVALDPATGGVTARKVLTTHGNLASGVLQAFTAASPDLRAVAGVVHGTTIATNAFLTRQGSRCGLVTTRGFRDIVELRRRDRPNTYGLRGSFEPLIPRDLRLEVDERVNARGEVEVPVPVDDVVAAARTLLSQGVDAVVVAFINSYANPANERTAKHAILSVWPNAFVTASTEVYPGFREFERWVTACANTFVQPVLSSYLTALESGMQRRGFVGRAYVMQSNGGAMSFDQARLAPVKTVLSGPAAGVSAAIQIARDAGLRNVISCDMGGTSFDVCLIADGRASVRRSFDLEYGLPLEVPAADIVSIGAGGGSVAWIDRGGILRVGPQSAGSSPGPACYGRGGTAPTVTDAHVVLGRIAADTALGGDRSLRIERTPAVAAIREVIGVPLGLGDEDAAESILRVANARLAGAVRLVSLERGSDPRDFALVMFGGAGPLHSAAIMDELGIGSAIIPFYAGLTSALGCAYADIRHDLMTSVDRPLERLDAFDVRKIQDDHARAGAELVAAEHSLGVSEVRIIHEADLSYVGQTHTLRVVLRGDPSSPRDIAMSFTDTYARQFGKALGPAEIWVSDLCTTVVVARAGLPSSLRAGATSLAGAQRTRPVYFRGQWHETAVVDRSALIAGDRVVGPAIIEQVDSTVAIEPGYTGAVDAQLSLILRRAP